MRSVLLDTHAWAWSLTGDARLSDAATQALTEAEAVFVSAISLYEIGQKVRLGKWPEMAPFLPRLIDLAGEQGAQLLALSAEASLLASTLAWDHRDPFDRLIGASALQSGLALVSADTVFDALSREPRWPGRLW